MAASASRTGTSTPAEKLVRCPTCGGDSVYAIRNPSRPFCSERCKNVDLGAWASEEFRVPTPDLADDESLGDPRLQ